MKQWKRIGSEWRMLTERVEKVVIPLVCSLAVRAIQLVAAIEVMAVVVRRGILRTKTSMTIFLSQQRRMGLTKV
jgi:hypothetical protein